MNYSIKNERKNNKMEVQEYILENQNSFKLKDIFECGQCFRWNKQEDESYTGVIKNAVINVKQTDNKIVFKGISENQGFYISSGNIVIYFQVYEIAPYVTGIPEFYIPVEKFDQKSLKYEIKPYTIRSALL